MIMNKVAYCFDSSDSPCSSQLPISTLGSDIDSNWTMAKVSHPDSNISLCYTQLPRQPLLGLVGVCFVFQRRRLGPSGPIVKRLSIRVNLLGGSHHLHGTSTGSLELGESDHHRN